MKMFTTRIIRRYGFRRVAIINVAIAALFVLACSLLAPATPLPWILLTLFIYGLARSLQFSTLATLAYADIGEAQKSAASTLWSVVQQMTIGMGIAFDALALRVAAYFRGISAGAEEVSEPHFVLTDFHWAFVMAGLLVLLTVLGYHSLARNAGSNFGGARQAGTDSTR